MYYRRLWLGNRTPWLKRRLYLTRQFMSRISQSQEVARRFLKL